MKRNLFRFVFFTFTYILFSQNLSAQTTTLVSIVGNGKLSYKADSMGNVVPDFSGVGYKNGDSSIPYIGVVKTVFAVAGDNLANVQSAIDSVSNLPLQSNGFRGAILFKAGTYNINGTLLVSKSGIVLRGEDTNTIFRETSTVQDTMLKIIGTGGVANNNSSQQTIKDAFVPIGAKSVTLGSASKFAVGDWVFVRREPNTAWIKLLKMDSLYFIDTVCTNWVAANYKMSYERKITGISGKVVTFDAPIMDPLDTNYCKSYVVKFSSTRIEKCGVENIKFVSTYTSSTDENHGWTAIYLSNLVHGWVKNVKTYYFGYSCVDMARNSAFITVDSCYMIDPVSIITGGRRYSFNISDGQRCLVQNCSTRNGRHDYVTGSIVSGPNVFYNCKATVQQADIGPHQRWATGILFDNITSNGEMNVQNRLIAGSGHGWSGAQVMYWNCKSANMVVQSPPSYHRNWAIGYIGKLTNVGQWITEPIGVVESTGKRIVAIPSLFKAQLSDRQSTTLPIVWASISAKLQEKAVVINWSTSSELNSKKYIVEHSLDGEQYSAIGSINAKGNSNTIANYLFIDETPVVGTNYYRVVAVDNDGKQNYSATKTIRVNGLATNTIDINPNPASNQITMELRQETGFLNGWVADINGKIILQANGNLAYINSVVNKKLSGFQKGIYFVKLINDKKTFSGKFIKL